MNCESDEVGLKILGQGFASMHGYSTKTIDPPHNKGGSVISG